MKDITLLVLLLFLPGISAAQEDPAADRTLIVGIKEAPPFTIRSPAGEWSGISAELWADIAGELELKFEFRELDLKGLLEGVRKGSLDVAIGALTVTPEREKEFDFTHAIHTTGLGIAAAARSGSPWLSVMKRIFSLAFLKVIGALCVVLLGVGLLVWWFERKRNPQQFGGTTAKGIGSGFWWSAVTMTTVGYGDKAPLTPAGRLVALVWMFAAIIIISTFTAGITTALTVSHFESVVQGPESLPSVRVGSVPGSSSAEYLERHWIAFRSFGDVEEGMRAVADDKIDALVYDAPLLQYLAKQSFQGVVEVLPFTFFRQDYGFALPDGSPLRERVNRVLLEKIGEPEWEDTLNRYLGL